MTLLPFRNLLRKADPPPTAAEKPHDYACLIVDNLPYIEAQCRKAVLNQHDFSGMATDLVGRAAIDNETDELLTELLDHLKADNYKPLREFKGTARLTTYLTTIIANLVVDLIRKKKGRSRAKERAKEMGVPGEQLYDLVFQRGYSISDAHDHLVISHGLTGSESDLREMCDKIRGRDFGRPTDDPTGWPCRGKELVVDDELELVVADPAGNAEDRIIDHQRERTATGCIDEMLSGLSGEERFILCLRFPSVEEEEPKDNQEIAEMLELTEKAVDNRIRRILLKCREALMAKGLALDDLICAEK